MLAFAARYFIRAGGGEMRNLLAIFSKSPLGPLHEMMTEIETLMELVPPMLEAVKADDQPIVKTIAKQIMHMEHEIDELKNEIRDHLPKSIFLPLDRKEFLTILSRLDGIADDIEDLAILFTLRHMTIPEGCEGLIFEVWDKVKATFAECRKLIEGFDDLISSGFAGPMADEFHQMVNAVNILEWESDKRVYKASQAILALEGSESPIAIMMWMKILDKMGDVADSCESMAKGIRLTLAK